MARYSINQQQENKKENKKEFNIGKDLGIIVLWLTIISIIFGILRALKVDIPYIIFTIIIVILLIVIWLLYRKLKSLGKNNEI